MRTVYIPVLAHEFAICVIFPVCISVYDDDARIVEFYDKQFVTVNVTGLP